jgi:hypothetical protein
MSDTLGTYSFLPWLRLGIANTITAADNDPTVKLRASIPVALTLTGHPVKDGPDLSASVSRNVDLYGPGDVIGIDPRAIVKVEPRNWITNFEPNNLPYVEFYEEDFPWRYTPAAPDLVRHRLRPWLALLVMEASEFKDAPTASGQPLAAIEVTGAAERIFPAADQLWAFAHVHVNRDLVQQDGVVTSTNNDLTRGRIEALLAANPDNAYSRILSPRKLEPNKGYHAFLVPSFESGRLAGLGQEVDPANPAFFATLSAWADYANRPLPTVHPVYHRWFFSTGTLGDFEYLVRLLKPRSPDARLGRRDMDTQDPGSNLPGIAEPALSGVLRLGGALKVPAEALDDEEEAEATRFENWDEPHPHAFQVALARRINLADDYQRNGDPDPIIVPPLYGQWHALTDRLLFEADDTSVPQPRNWVHELNLDPRFRVAAAFGTRVIQKNQEAYMDTAWDQVGDIIEANRRIRFAQLAREASFIWHGKHLRGIRTLNTERALALMSPVQRRVVAGGMTVRANLARSIVPRASLSAPLRRLIRPRDHVAAALGFATPKGPEVLIDRINKGEVSAAPPRVPPAALPSVDDAAEKLAPPGVPPAVLDLLKRYPWLKWLVLFLLLLLALLLAAFSIALALIVATIAAAAIGALIRIERQAGIADAVRPEGSSPPVVDALPTFPDFTIRDPSDPTAPEPASGSGVDSGEAMRFKIAIKDGFRLIDESAKLGAPPVRARIDIAAITDASFTAIDPQKAIPAFILSGITFPDPIAAINGEAFREAMAYPQFDIPMYAPLMALSAEHFLPNIDKIPPNTITLLETNQRFIEAYMVGLNHEFARELLWREYPTDQRGSYFRQFWDPSGVMNTQNLSKDALREKLRDIPPIHTWSLRSSLGEHDNREQPGAKEDELVLVIRGELLKKYPTAVIYAQKARWQRDAAGKIIRTVERILETEGPQESFLRTPLYEAKADPDITFIGFDLTAKVAKGGTGEPGDEEPGWFFVIKERPGEPRFGLDIDRGGELSVWNDLAWPDVFDDAADNGFLQVKATTPTITLSATSEPEKQVQHNEDKGLSWRADMNAAEVAYILYQVPVLVAVHASEMLPA